MGIHRQKLTKSSKIDEGRRALRGLRGVLHYTSKSFGWPNLRSPGNSIVVYLVMKNGNLEYGGRRCGFNTKHKSTNVRSALLRSGEGQARFGTEGDRRTGVPRS